VDVVWECIEVLDIYGLLEETVKEGTELYDFFVSSELLNETRERMHFENPDIANPS
jgi:hypothetical protein